MKTLERLRLQKTKAVDRMAELNSLATKETRDLTAVEKMEYESRKLEAENLTASIADLETELAAQPKAEPKPAPAAEPADNSAALKAERDTERQRGATIRDRLAAAKLPADITLSLTKELIDGGEGLDKASTRIFEELAKRSEAQPDQRAGLAVQNGETLARVETMARDLVTRDGLTKEAAIVRVLNSNPKFYDQYLAANPAQTGARQ